MRRLSLSYRLTLGAMIAALTLLALYAATVLPTGRIACYFLSSIFIYVLVCEKAYASAIACFLAICGLAYLLIPDKTTLMPYAFLLGHYGIFKQIADTRISHTIPRVLAKLIYCNLWTSPAVYIAAKVLGASQLTQLLPDVALWILIIAAEFAFVAFDLLYAFCQRIYEANIRKSLITRR